MQEVQAGDGTSSWRVWPILHAKVTGRKRIPGTKVPPLLEKVEFAVGEFIWDHKVTLAAEVEWEGDGSGQKGRFSSGGSSAWVADISGKQGRIPVGWLGGRIGVDLG